MASENLQSLALPGDILMYRTGTRSPVIAKLIAIGELFYDNEPTYTEYYHIAIVKNALYKYEATWPKSGENPIDWDNPRIELWRVKGITQEQISQVLAKAASKVNPPEWYNLPDILLLGHFPRRHMDICSTFAQTSFLGGNIDFKNVGHKLPLPDDFPDSGLIQQIDFSCPTIQ